MQTGSRKNKRNWLLEETTFKKMNHYDAAFRILVNHIAKKSEDIDKMDAIARKSDKTFEGIMKSIQILMNTQLILKEQFAS